MKKLYFLIPVFALLLTACSKRDYYPPQEINENEWMRTHDHAIVAYVDYETGNYIVDTYDGYSVVEAWDNSSPIENDHQYAFFNSRGVQTIYSRSGRYFSKGRIVETWLSFDDALYILDDLRYNK